MCSRPASNLFCKQNRLVNIVCEVRISCKEHLATFCMFFLTSKTNLMSFQTAPVLVYIMSMPKHQYH